jgi:hypothetical protein
MSNASPGRHSGGRQHTFPHEREAIDASRLAMYGNWLPNRNRGDARFPQDVGLRVIWTVLRNFTGTPFIVAGLYRHVLVAASTTRS